VTDWRPPIAENLSRARPLPEKVAAACADAFRAGCLVSFGQIAEDRERAWRAWPCVMIAGEPGPYEVTCHLAGMVRRGGDWLWVPDARVEWQGVPVRR
jgi:hypothetical protein